MVGSGEHGGRVYPRPDRRSCRPMLASGVAWGGTLSALRPHHLSITLIARCIAKYRSPRHVSLLWTGRVHGPYPLIIAERPSELKPNAAMFHGASRECPPRDPRILNRSVTGVDEVFRRNQKKYAEATVYDASQSGPPGF